jgi:hypothetical protein
MLIDAWEHDYYLQYQNRKTEFFEAVWLQGGAEAGLRIGGRAAIAFIASEGRWRRVPPRTPVRNAVPRNQ